MISISDLFASSDNSNSLGAKFRQKRLANFESLFFKNFDKYQTIRILDVGGTDYFWKESSLPKLPNIEITLLNLVNQHICTDTIKGRVGDGTNMPEYADDHFDLVFSNSVIEHLYTWKNQEKMAKEILRVGKKYYIQTPNKHFPIEAHYALPFAQNLPKSWMEFILTKTRLSRLKKWSVEDAKQYLEEIRLLDEKEMKTLFPDCTIYKENWVGMTKSITAHNL